MSDSALVSEAGISSAIIVDDGYDEVPQVAELLDEAAWDTLFDDARGDNAVKIEALFTDFDPEKREDLKSSQEFIEALWQGREGIRDLLAGLFDEYEQKARDNLPSLNAAEAALDALSIPFVVYGRDFVEAAVEADLIIIDLYLGIQQGAQDRELTVELLKEVITRRGDRSLPSIVLMSQVPTIDEEAKVFRKDVKLHASAFRSIRKSNLSTPGRMKGLILTLASHRADSQALATFVETWETKAVEAVQEATGTLRKIDIDDLHHIRNMLLRFEGVKTSSYMLDVFDRVLQYEIEAHKEVLDAALPLDKLADDPPLMISNDRDTYAVLERTLYVNPMRRGHSTGAVWPIMFGDILGLRPGVQATARGFFSGREDMVFFVASPECDLIRKDGLTTALLVAGTLKGIDMTKPVLPVTSSITPVIKLEDDNRFQIEWDFGELSTVKLGQVKLLLHPVRGSMSVLSRFREGSALSLRQQLLSNIGRVGELAPLPRSFRFRADLYLPLQEGSTEKIEMPAGVAITGNVLLPRGGKYARVIIDSNCEDELTTVLLGLDSTNFASKSKAKLQILQKQSRLQQIFRSGFQVRGFPFDKPRAAGLLKPGEEQPSEDSKPPKTDPVSMIVQGEDFERVLGGDLSAAGLIFQIHADDEG